MPITVSIVAPGAMGAGVAQRLTENGVAVLTSLAGRSAASERRARAAGMRAVDDAQLTEADLLLSIVPPGEALALARRLAPVLTAANKKPVYVECNAVSPQTVRRIAEVVAAPKPPSSAPASSARRPSPARPIPSSTSAARPPALRHAHRLRADRAPARRRAHRRRGAENVLCRHHQGLHRARRRHAAGFDPRRRRRSAQGRARRKPAGLLGSWPRGRCRPCMPRPTAGWPSSTRSRPSSAPIMPSTQC